MVDYFDGKKVDWEKLEQHLRSKGTPSYVIEYVKEMGPTAEKYAAIINVPTNILLGQWAYESGYGGRMKNDHYARNGNRMLASETGNNGGLKGSRSGTDDSYLWPDGPSSKFYTYEYHGGRHTVLAPFRDYKKARAELVQRHGDDKVPSYQELFARDYMSKLLYSNRNFDRYYKSSDPDNFTQGFRYRGAFGAGDATAYGSALKSGGYFTAGVSTYIASLKSRADKMMPGFNHVPEKDPKALEKAMDMFKNPYFYAQRSDRQGVDFLIAPELEGKAVPNADKTKTPPKAPPPPPPINEDEAKKGLDKLPIKDFNLWYKALRQRAEEYNGTEGLAEDKKVKLPKEAQLVDPATVEDDPSTPENEKELAQKAYEQARAEMTDQIIKTSKELQERGNLTPKTQKEEQGESQPDAETQPDAKKQHQQETERKTKQKSESQSTENTRSHLNGPGNNMPDDILILLLLLMLIAPEAAMQIWNWYMSGQGNNPNNGPSDSTTRRVRNKDGTPRKQQGLESPDDVKTYRENKDPNTERFKTKSEFENGGHNRSLFGSGIPSEVNGEQVNYVPGVTHQIPFKKDGPRFQQFGIRLWDSKEKSESKVLYYIADKETGKIIYSAVHDSGGEGRNAAPGTSTRDILAEIASDPSKAKLWKENPILAKLSNEQIKGYLNTPHKRDKDALDQAKLYMLGLPPGNGEPQLTNVRDIIARGVERYKLWEKGQDPKTIPGYGDLPEGMRIINFNPKVMDKLEIDLADIAKGKLSLPKLRAGESRIALNVGHGWRGKFDPGTTALQKQVERAARAAGISGDFSIFNEHNMAAVLMRELKTQLMLKSKDGVHYRDDQVYIMQATREMRLNTWEIYPIFRNIARQNDATVYLDGHFNDSGKNGSDPRVKGAAMYFYSSNRPTPEGKDLAERIAKSWEQNGVRLWSGGVKYQARRLGMMSGSNFRGKRSDGSNMAHGLIEGEFLDHPEAFRLYVEEVKDASGKTIGYRVNRDAMRKLAAPIAQAIHEQQLAMGLGPGKAFEGEPERPPVYAYYVKDLGENEGLQGSGPPRPYEREKLTRRELANAIVQKLPSGTEITHNKGEAITAILDSQGRLVSGNLPFERVDPASTAKHAVVLALIKMDEAGKLPKDFWSDPKNITDLKMIALPKGVSLDNYNRATQRLVARAMDIEVPANGSVSKDHEAKMASFINTYMNGAIVDQLGLVDTHFSDKYMVAQRGGFKGYSGLVGMNTEKGGDDGNYVTAYDGVRIQQALAKYSGSAKYGTLIDNLLASKSGSLGTISSGFSGDKAQWVAKTGTAGGDYGPKREGESGVRAFVAAHKTHGYAFGVYETHKSKIGSVVGDLRAAALRNKDGVDIQAIKRQVVEERIRQERIEIETQQQERKQPSRHEFYPGDSALSKLKLAQDVAPVSPITAMPKASLRDLIARHYPQHHDAMNKLAADLGIEGKLDVKMTAIDYMKFITGRTDLLSADLQKEIGDLPKAFKDSLYERGKGDGTPLARFNMSGGKAPYCAGTIANALMLSYPEIAAAWQRKDVFDNLSGYHQSEIEGEDVGDGKYKYGKIVDVQAFYTVGEKLGLLQTNDDGTPATYGNIKYDDLKEGSIIAFAPKSHKDHLASPKGSAKTGMSGHHLAMIVGKGSDAKGDFVLVASGNNGHGPNGEKGQSGLHTYKAYKQADGTIKELGGSKRPVAWHMPPERLQAYRELYQATAERIKVEQEVQTRRQEVRVQVPDTKRFSVLDGILPRPERQLRSLIKLEQPVIKQGHVYDPKAKWFSFGDSSAVQYAAAIDGMETYKGTMAQGSAGVIPTTSRTIGSALLLEVDDWNKNLPKIGKDSHANIMVSMGYNDVGLNTSAGQIMDKMRPILDKMIADGTNPVIAGLHSGSKHYSATAQEKIRALNRLLENYSKEHGLVYVDVAAIEKQMGSSEFLSSDNLHISEKGRKAVFEAADQLLQEAAKQAAEKKQAAERAEKSAELIKLDVKVETKPSHIKAFVPLYNADGTRNKIGDGDGEAKKTYGEQEWLGLTAEQQRAQPWRQEMMGALNGENGAPQVDKNAYTRKGKIIGTSIPREPLKNVPIIPTALYKYANEEGWVGFKIADQYGLNARGGAAVIGQIGMYNIRTGQYKVFSFASGGKGGVHEGQRGAPSPTLVSHDTWGSEQGEQHELINGVTYVGSSSFSYRGSKLFNGKYRQYGASIDWIDAVEGRGDTMMHRVFGTPERVAQGRFSEACEATPNNKGMVQALRDTKMDLAGSRFFSLNADRVKRLPDGMREMPVEMVPEEYRFVRDLPVASFSQHLIKKAELGIPGGIKHAFVSAGVTIAEPEEKKATHTMADVAAVRVAMVGQIQAIERQEAAARAQLTVAALEDVKSRAKAAVKPDGDGGDTTKVKADGEVETGKDVEPTPVAVAKADDADPKKKDQAVASATA